jgi:metal-dependent amidase/aminoacylase/carboxypeptidase family protein
LATKIRRKNLSLEDLKNTPLLYNKSLKIQGPSGLAGTRTLTVTFRVESKTVNETIKLIPEAVVTGAATMDHMGTKITVEETGTANCYWLPWGTGKVYVGQLGGDHEYFFTYTINGCGVFIGGTETHPLIAHANLDSERLDTIANNAGALISKEPKKAMSISAQAGEDQAEVYDQFYFNLGTTMITGELMSGARLEVVTPQQYLINAGAGYGAVFGIQNGGRWTFYGNWASKTKKIWP